MASRVVPQEASDALERDEQVAEQAATKDAVMKEDGQEEVLAEPEKDSSTLAMAPEDAEGGEKEQAVIPASRKELWGWYLYDFAANAFYAVALPIFFPLLLTTLANEQAYRQQGEAAIPECAPDLLGPCLVCVPGEGMQLNTTNVITDYQQPKVYAGSLGMDPVAYATAMGGIAVLVQVFAFLTFGPLADYGHGRKHMLMAGTLIGASMCILTLMLEAISLWWLSGVYLVLASLGFGLACICFNSYLSVLTDAHPVLLKAKEEEPSNRVLETREKVINSVSLTAIAVGSVGAVLSLALAALLTLATSDSLLQLRFATTAMGIWWLLFSIAPFLWLRDRVGPPLPKKGLSALSGWRRMGGLILHAKKYKNAFWFILCYFVYADSYLTLTQIGVLFSQRMLCMDNLTLILLVASVSLWAGIGAGASYWLQRWLRFNSKQMVLLMLALMTPLPLWGLLGYVTPEGTVGLKHVWEVFVFAGWFGLLLGPILSFSRTCFIDMIPVGSEATFFSLYSISDKGSSWVGPLIVALLVQLTGSLRASFFYILGVIVIPALVLWWMVDYNQGLVDAGRVPDSPDRVEDVGRVESVDKVEGQDEGLPPVSLSASESAHSAEGREEALPPVSHYASCTSDDDRATA